MRIELPAISHLRDWPIPRINHKVVVSQKYDSFYIIIPIMSKELEIFRNLHVIIF